MKKNIRYDALNDIMRIVTAVGLTLLLLSADGIIASILLGTASVALVIFIPVIVFEGVLPVISFILLMAGILVLASSGIGMKRGNGRTIERGSWGGIAFVGPFPILFGDMKDALPLYVRIVLIIAASIIAIVVLFTFLYMFLR